MTPTALHKPFFLLLLGATTVGFGLILWPFAGALFWSVALAVLLEPFYRAVLSVTQGRRGLSALCALAGFVLLAVLPSCALIGTLVSQAQATYQRVRSGEIDFGAYFAQIMATLPSSVSSFLNEYGLADIQGLKHALTLLGNHGAHYLATHVLDWGQNLLQVGLGFAIALYVAFFLLRDGPSLRRALAGAIPMPPSQQQQLAARFATVVRATIKGSVVVALVQGVLGGLMFWVLDINGAVLWGSVMAVLSLVPAVGAGLVWLPVALYQFADGSVFVGLGVISYGILVIGSADNVLRPILVGQDVKLPDALILLSTLGGIAVLGINGLVLGPMLAALFVTTWSMHALPDEQARATEAAP